MLLAVLPALVFGVPALLGHAVLPGDDMTQNFPLRVLAGHEIRAGHLPLYDPYIWSGSPLLAGWNAGAAYPLTLLFVVLPGVAAWTLGLIITWSVAGIGMFCFLRALRLGSLASFLGALSFALAGAMSAQVTHFGLIAGMSWVPLALLAVLRLTGPGRRGLASRLRWSGVLAASIGLVILAGEPRAIVDAAAIVGIYAVWRLAHLGRRSGPAAVGVFGGGLLGVCLGAVQWLPGLDAIAVSQRGSGSMALFSSGSLPVRWLLLTLVPDLLGGSGSLSQPSFFGSYNLTEVTSYVGLLPLVAAFALLARIRLRPRLPEWVVWHLMAVAGIVLALGGNTFLGPLLYHVPLFGSQRLQSRNIVVLDLALSVLLAYWADQPFPARGPVRALAGGDQGLAVRGLAVRSRALAVRGLAVRSRALAVRGRALAGAAAETLLGLVPPLAVIAVVAAGLIWGAGLLHWLGVSTAQSASIIGQLRPWLVPYAVIGAAAIALLVSGRRLRRRVWARLCAGFVVADIVVFSILAVVSVAPAAPTAQAAATAQAGGSGSAASTTASLLAASTVPSSALTAVPASAARPLSELGYRGRYAIYDPDVLDSGQLSALRPPDLTGMSAGDMPSVQGYSSIVDGTYASATGAHQATGAGQNMLAPAAVGNGTLDQLDTSILLTLPPYLTSAGSSGGASDVADGRASAASDGERHISADQRTTWYLAQSLTVSKVQVPDADARQDAAAGTRIGLTAPDGSTRWFTARAANASTLEITLARPMASTAIMGQANGAPCPLGAPSVFTQGGSVLVADGALQNALVPPRWEFAGFDGSFAVFADQSAVAPLSVQALPGRPASGASVAYVSGAAGEPTAATVSSAHGVRLIRSVAAIPGWSAIWHPAHGQAVPLAVQRDGLVQAVDVPPGKGTITWRYTAPGFAVGLVLSLTAAAGVLLLFLGGRLTWLRGRPRLNTPDRLDESVEAPGEPSPEDEGLQVL